VPRRRPGRGPDCRRSGVDVVAPEVAEQAVDGVDGAAGDIGGEVFFQRLALLGMANVDQVWLLRSGC
jgi:hypothetical protein